MRPALPTSLALAGVIAFTVPAHASFPTSTVVECPGGSTTKVMTPGAAYSTFGRRLDGREMTSFVSPRPLPVCPDGFIVYKPLAQFPAEELQRARAVVATPDYQRIVREGPPYLALSHIAGKMGWPEDARLLMLLSASWQIEEDRTRYEALQRRFADEMGTYLAKVGPEWDGYWMAASYVINAHRVTGNFEVAQARLSALDLAALKPKSDDPLAQRGIAKTKSRLQYLGELIAQGNRDIDPEAVLPPLRRRAR